MTSVPIFSTLRPGVRGHTRPDPVATHIVEEVRHDAIQAVATVLALVAAGAQTVDDPTLTALRLRQIENQVRALRTFLGDIVLDEAPTAVDVAAETCELVTPASVGYAGTVGVVADTSARAEVTGPVLRRIVGNVVRNAMRAAGPDGHVQVSVTPGAQEVTIDVEDDGPGFGALPIVHGIGLRSVRRLVHHAGGRLDTASRGRLGGASVRIHLPSAALGVRS